MIACNKCRQEIMATEARVTQPIVGSNQLDFHLRCYPTQAPPQEKK